MNELRYNGCAAQAPTNIYFKLSLAFIIMRQFNADIMKLKRGSVIDGCTHGDFELAW